MKTILNGDSIMKFFDRVLFLMILPIYFIWYEIYKILSNKTSAVSGKRKILFLCSGSALRYPNEKTNDKELRKAWDSGLGPKSQLLHQTFDMTYALYWGTQSSCYKLCPNVLGIVLKKVELKYLPRTSRMLSSIKLIIFSAKLNQDVGFYTVETFLPGDMLLISTFVSKVLRVPLVVQCQGDFDLSHFDEDISKETFKKLCNRNIQKAIFSYVLKHAKLVLGYSDHCASFAICNGASPHKVRRCRIKSFIEEFKELEMIPKDQLTFYPKDNSTVFLWCRLASEKKLAYCFEAMKKVFLVDNSVKLLVAGDGPLRDIFEAQLADFKSNVIFLGHLNRSELKSYIKYSDVCLVPLGGHSLIEAGMCEKGIVGFNWEWHGEVITNHESGLLVDYPNVDDFSNAVLWTINNPQHANKMGEKLHKRIWKLFNQDAVMQREVKIWNDFHKTLGAML